jgi:hypothetical protein
MSIVAESAVPCRRRRRIIGSPVQLLQTLPPIVEEADATGSINSYLSQLQQTSIAASLLATRRPQHQRRRGPIPRASLAASTLLPLVGVTRVTVGGY